MRARVAGLSPAAPTRGHPILGSKWFAFVPADGVVEWFRVSTVIAFWRTVVSVRCPCRSDHVLRPPIFRYLQIARRYCFAILCRLVFERDYLIGERAVNLLLRYVCLMAKIRRWLGRDYQMWRAISLKFHASVGNMRIWIGHSNWHCLTDRD